MTPLPGGGDPNVRPTKSPKCRFRITMLLMGSLYFYCCDSACPLQNPKSGKPEIPFSAPRNHDSQTRDRILRLNYTGNLEKRKQSTGGKSKKSSGDGAPKLQISVPVTVKRVLTLPESKNALLDAWDLQWPCQDIPLL